ncbi:hypothetical protein D3C71_1859800 [compost metagenome]
MRVFWGGAEEEGVTVSGTCLSTRDRPRKGPEHRLTTCPWLCSGEVQFVRNKSQEVVSRLDKKWTRKEKLERNLGES